MELLSWVLGLVGVIGIGGVIAACILIPAVAIPLLQSIVSWLLRCAPCLWLLAVLAAGIGGWWYGHHTAVLECREAELAAELRNREIDLENASKARSDETKRADDIEKQSKVREQNDADYIKHLEGRAPCLFGDDDVGLRTDDRARAKKLTTRPK